MTHGVDLGFIGGLAFKGIPGRGGTVIAETQNLAAKAAGFLVTSNTTIYKETDIEEIADLLGMSAKSVQRLVGKLREKFLT